MAFLNFNLFSKKDDGWLDEDKSKGGLFAGRKWLLWLLIGIAAVLVIFLLVIFLATRSGARKVSTVAPGTLTAGIVNGNDRYARYDENGLMTGIEPQLAQQMADAEGLTLRIVEAVNTEQLYSLLNSGAIDVAFGRISDNSDMTGYTTSSEYARCGLFLVTRLHDYTNSLHLLTGYSIGVMNNVAMTAQQTDNYMYVNTKEYVNASMLGEEVNNRIINMGICSERDALSLVTAYPSALQMQEIAGGPKEAYVAVFPGRQNSRAFILNAIIDEMK